MSAVEKAYWSRTYVVGSVKVYAFERLDRSGRVFVKFSSPHKRGRDRRVKEKLPGDLTVRDAKGRIDRRMVRLVDEAVERIGAQLLLGQRRESTHSERRPLTLSEGFAAALDIGAGKYPAKTRRWEEVKRAQAKLERLLGRDKVWEQITPSDVRRVWRALATEAGGSHAAAAVRGARQAEVTVDALYSVANWLREEERIPPNAALPMTKWRSKLRDEWPTITGSAAAVARPRHTMDEMRRIFEAVHDPRVDPRLGLAMDLGGEQRLGQVLRCRRSQLELPAVNADSINTLEPGQLGVLRVQSAGRKRAMPIVLTGEQRHAVEAALSGYLTDFESAYRRGNITDYLLFPAGRLKKGKAKVVARPKPLTRDAARRMFRELERVANVKSVAGRGWYGIRRIAADAAEDVEKDERVLNSITGHRDSSTRRLVYQDGERAEVLIKAAITRAKIRRGSGAPPATPTAQTA